jgi:hypothetical protein
MAKATRARKGPVPRPLAERFWEKVNKDGPLPEARAIARWPEIKGTRCWIYGSGKGKRYGSVHVEHGHWEGAHRVAWFLETGAWPEPCCLHKCDVPKCVRFSHLFEGTHKDDTADMIAKGRDALIGERSHLAKLTAADVREIRRLGAPCVRHLWKRGTALLKKRLAKRFGTTTGHVNGILRNKRWKPRLPDEG